MGKYARLQDQPKKSLGIFFRSIPTADTPDSKWGLVQIGLSFSFFFFALDISAIQFYNTPLWGYPLMIIAIVLGAMAFIGIVGTIIFAWYIWSKNQSDYPILIVTKEGELKINPKNIKLEMDNGISITTDKYEIEIRILKKEGDTNGIPK